MMAKYGISLNCIDDDEWAWEVSREGCDRGEWIPVESGDNTEKWVAVRAEDLSVLRAALQKAGIL